MSVEQVTVESGGVNLVGDHWIPDAGSRGSVVMLHGGGQRRFSWKRTGERLARDGWSAYAFDARGHGDSDWAPDGDYSHDALIGDLLTVAKSVGEPPVLVGASMGGITSLMAAGENHGIARAIVLVDIVARLEPDGLKRIHDFMTQAPDGFASLDDVADAVAAYTPHRARPRNLDGLKKNVRQRADGRWYWHWDPTFLDGGDEATRGTRYERSIEAATNLDVPTMLVRGRESDLVSPEGVAEMAALIRDVVTVDVSGAGHMVAGDDNDVFTVKLEEFLDRLPPR